MRYPPLSTIFSSFIEERTTNSQNSQPQQQGTAAAPSENAEKNSEQTKSTYGPSSNGGFGNAGKGVSHFPNSLWKIPILDENSNYMPEALSCGHDGIVFKPIGLHNVLEATTLESVPKQLKLDEKYKNMKIVALVRNHESRYLLFENGDVFGWGQNSFGNLGKIPCAPNDEIPELIKFPESKKGKVIQLFTGFYSWHIFFLTDQNELFACGCEQLGRLGFSQKAAADPQLVPLNDIYPAKIVTISCGGFHSLLLTDRNELFSCGDNEFGQLGFKLSGDLKFKDTFTKIPTFSRDLPSSHAGPNNASPSSSSSIPTLSLSPQGFSRKLLVDEENEIVSVKAGRTSSFVLTRGGTMYAWGELREFGLVDNLVADPDKVFAPVHIHFLDNVRKGANLLFRPMIEENINIVKRQLSLVLESIAQKFLVNSNRIEEEEDAEEEILQVPEKWFRSEKWILPPFFEFFPQKNIKKLKESLLEDIASKNSKQKASETPYEIGKGSFWEVDKSQVDKLLNDLKNLKITSIDIQYQRFIVVCNYTYVFECSVNSQTTISDLRTGTHPSSYAGNIESVTPRLEKVFRKLLFPKEYQQEKNKYQCEINIIANMSLNDSSAKLKRTPSKSEPQPQQVVAQKPKAVSSKKFDPFLKYTHQIDETQAKYFQSMICFPSEASVFRKFLEELESEKKPSSSSSPMNSPVINSPNHVKSPSNLMVEDENSSKPQKYKVWELYLIDEKRNANLSIISPTGGSGTLSISPNLNVICGSDRSILAFDLYSKQHFMQKVFDLVLAQAKHQQASFSDVAKQLIYGIKQTKSQFFENEVENEEARMAIDPDSQRADDEDVEMEEEPEEEETKSAGKPIVVIPALYFADVEIRCSSGMHPSS